MNPSQRLKVRETLPLAVQETLERFSVQQLNEAPQDIASEQTLLVSILGFKSPQMNGSILLACQESFLAQTCPGLKADEPNRKPFIYDWIGELTNLVAGYFKNSLLSFDIDLGLNPPSISEANLRVLETYASRMPSESIWFSVDGKTFCLVFCAEIDPALNLEPEQAVGEASVKPGDAVYQPPQMEPDPGDLELKPDTDGYQSLEMDQEVSGREQCAEAHESDDVKVEKGADILEFELKSFEPIENSDQAEEAPVNAPARQEQIAEMDNRSEIQPPQEAAMIDSIQTTRHHELIIHFMHGVSYTIPVEQWLADGRHEVKIEGQSLKLSQTATTHVVDIQGMRIDFHKRQAA
ncbi:MAG: chemotaxis protein CheX [Oligoflexus sp.]